MLVETESSVSVSTEHIGNGSPVEVGDDVFVATCNFRGYGTLVAKEYLEQGSTTKTCITP
jgi:hypothetical protein